MIGSQIRQQAPSLLNGQQLADQIRIADIHDRLDSLSSQIQRGLILAMARRDYLRDYDLQEIRS